MAQFEDPKEQLFHNTLEELYKIGSDKEVDVETRVKALDELQKGYLTFRSVETNDEGIKTVGKALKQSKRLLEED